MPRERMEPLDRLALDALDAFAREVVDDYHGFRLHDAYLAIQRFDKEDLSAFYGDALKDRLYSSAPNAPRRRSAQSALLEIFRTTCVLLAPVLSFTAEEAWQYLPAALRGDAESVFDLALPRVERGRRGRAGGVGAAQGAARAGRGERGRSRFPARRARRRAGARSANGSSRSATTCARRWSSRHCAGSARRRTAPRRSPSSPRTARSASAAGSICRSAPTPSTRRCVRRAPASCASWKRALRRPARARRASDREYLSGIWHSALIESRRGVLPSRRHISADPSGRRSLDQSARAMRCAASGTRASNVLTS